MGPSNLMTKRWSSEPIWVLFIVVWWCVEDRRWRQQRSRNYLLPSSSRSFRTQPHWSYTAGHCVNSNQFLRVHLSYRMCSQFTLHHKFRINSGRTKFNQGKQEGILHGRESHEKDHIDPRELDLTKSRLASYNRSGKNTRIRCIGPIYSLFNGKDLSSINKHVTQSSSTIHSQLIVSRK